ncbi:MAG: hypothetical protein ABDH32_01455 [Candidatus Caldarchaeales archaeon]
MLTHLERCGKVEMLSEIVNNPNPTNIYDENTPMIYDIPKIKTVNLLAPAEYVGDMKRARRLKLHIFKPSKIPKNKMYGLSMSPT